VTEVIEERAQAAEIAVPSVDALPGEQPIGWRHRHLLDVDGLSTADLDLVMRTADAMREVLARPIAKVPALRGRNVTILFYEASTRTRVSFEVAAKNLSAEVVNIAASTSSVTKGESLVDTVRTVEALGAQMLVIRHSVSGAPYLAAEIFGGSVLNGGDGWHAHPTQALLDLYTMRSRLGSVEGRKVVILGDVLHSRVARSNIWSLTAAGADLWLCGPPTLLRGFEAWAAHGAAAGRRFNVTSSIDTALRDADVVNVTAATSSVTKGESLVDTVRTLEALGAQMLVMRHGSSGAPYLAAEVFGGSVLNGGDGWHAHPTQALLDLYTIRSRLGSVAGKKVVILGDVLHSRVARSNIWTLTAAGADLWLCGPTTLLRGFESWARHGVGGERRFQVTSSIDDALRDADVVMALRIQRERMASGLLPSLREYAARYGLTAARLASAKPDALVMHPGPMNEGVEIAPDVAAGAQSVITDQVTNGVAIRMALLYLLAGVPRS